MTEPLTAGATIGILGGGQLARMLSVSASRLGYRCHVYDPAPEAPAGHVAERLWTADYDAPELEDFARSCDVITYEFENVPTEALDRIETIRPIHPCRRALAISQDRLIEKRYLADLGIATAPFAEVADLESLHQALEVIGTPAILKTRRFGYDGKGQAKILSLHDAKDAWEGIGGSPAILEGFVDFTCEISVIAARSLSGDVVCFDPGQNAHREGILRRTTVPAQVPAGQRADAVLMAGKLLNALDYVGVLGLELFVTPAGLVANEYAPRVHNSGHWTQNGCVVDQFEQHIRAITGWPLGEGRRHSDVVMDNLIGDDLERVHDLARDPSVALHLYGKAETRSGRKMGHANRVLPRG